MSGRRLRRLRFALALGVALSTGAFAAKLGGFEGQGDIGGPRNPGAASYAGGAYTVTAGGANMFGAHDEFHFVWRRVKGDFVIRSFVAFAGPGVEDHRKAGVMARASLAADAAYVDATVHGNGPTALQTRRAAGGETEMQVTQPAPDAAPVDTAAQPGDFVQLERRGATYIVTIARHGQPVSRREIGGIDLGTEAYVGLFLCAHDAAATEKAVFRGVTFARSAARASTAAAPPLG